MNYKEAIEYLYASAPLFQNIGAGAYKEGLYNTHVLDAHFGHPHTKYQTIHIAGTNGKGSCAHTLAAILQAQGYRTGLYTSPHLLDFRERIKVDGEMIPEEEVVDFVVNERHFFEPLHPSFFELTTAMAFNYFARQKVDVAVIEVGMGGRLDCTNIITPVLSVITNISLDHTQFLGDTPAKIAREKAGIIKPGIPVLIGEATEETRPVFSETAKANAAPLVFAEDSPVVESFDEKPDGIDLRTTMFSAPLHYELGGYYQSKNANTILWATKLLRTNGIEISHEAIRKGFAHVNELTGLRGRWEIVSHHPTVIIDTGHNPGGLAYNMRQLKALNAPRKHIVVGMVADKDVRSSLKLMPSDATYYFTKASVKRALDERKLSQMAQGTGLKGQCYPNVAQAVQAAMSEAGEDDVVYIGGSNFIVADFLKTGYPRKGSKKQGT